MEDENSSNSFQDQSFHESTFTSLSQLCSSKNNTPPPSKTIPTCCNLRLSSSLSSVDESPASSSHRNDYGESVLSTSTSFTQKTSSTTDSGFSYYSSLEPSDSKIVLSKNEQIDRVRLCIYQGTYMLNYSLIQQLYLENQFVRCDESVPIEMGNQSTYRFVCALTVLQDVYKLLKTNTHRTKRGIFYDHKKLFGECTSLDLTLKQVCHLLNEPRINLHILSSSKGLLIGDLKYLTKDGNVCDCQSSVVSILPCVEDILRLESDARFILVVEKDTIFQRLCQEIFHKVYSPCIVITAKGYPDYPTRQMLHKLVSTLKIPLFALVDCDPHGIEIYLTYKYGSSTHYDINVENIDLTSIRWIGAFPSEIESFIHLQRLHIEQSHLLVLSAREKSKIKSLLSRSNVKKDEFLEHQLRKMLTLGFKVELEAICAKAENYITTSYFRAKLPKLLRNAFVLSER